MSLVADSEIFDFPCEENGVVDSKPAVPGFDEKFVFCGDYVIRKHYSKPYVIGVKKDNVQINYLDTDRSKPKRYDNLKKTRDTVAQIVYTNLSDYTKFLTLTTKESILEVKVFQRKLTTFIQAMKRQGFELKYLYVYERQNERGKKENNSGALHVHMIIFNDEFIPMDVIKKCWKHGRVELKILNGLRCKDNKKTEELIRNPASYVCKYITKESVAEWNEKIFRCSKNLKRPVEVNNEVWLYSGGGVRAEVSENLDSHFELDYNVLFESTKVCRYSTTREVARMFLDTTVAKRKEL